ncbi:MAG: hypothetical protein FJ368_05145 [Pelagibacterales bacterium]|nr:hypothetical protein [Pelagibacterales bacterium]
MKKLLFFIIIFSLDVFAKDSDLISKENFYIGVDATKNDKTIGKIDNSVAVDKVEEDRYYGYKLGNNGFFVAPEVSISKSPNQATQNSSTTSQTRLSDPLVNYNLRANIGYDFNKYFSGFVTYDVAKFSLDSGQNSFGINANSNINSGNVPIIGVGSQINLSNDFGVKFSYSQQQFENSSNGNAKISSDVIKIGTVYSF